MGSLMANRKLTSRHRIKPCPSCGEYAIFYGTQKVCDDCKARRVISPEGQQKKSAQLAVQDAVRRGELIRQPCVVCTERGFAANDKAHGHHEDYSKPLDVIWLCPMHHKWIHMNGYASVFSYRNKTAA